MWEKTHPLKSSLKSQPLFRTVCAQRALANSWFGGDSVVNERGSLTSVSTIQELHWLTLLSGVQEVFVALETECLCKFVSLEMFGHGEPYISGALQAQSSLAYSSSTVEGEFPEPLCIEQGVVLSCRCAQSKVRWISRVLWMAVVGQSSVKSSHRNSASSSVGANPFLIQIVIL